MADVQSQPLAARPTGKEKVSLNGFLSSHGKEAGERATAMLLGVCGDVNIEALLAAAKNDLLPGPTPSTPVRRSKPRSSSGRLKNRGDVPLLPSTANGDANINDSPPEAGSSTPVKRGKPRSSSCRIKNRGDLHLLSSQSAHVNAVVAPAKSSPLESSSDGKRSKDTKKSAIARSKSFDKRSTTATGSGKRPSDIEKTSVRKAGMERSKSFDVDSTPRGLKRIPRNPNRPAPEPVLTPQKQPRIRTVEPATPPPLLTPPKLGSGRSRGMGDQQSSQRKMGDKQSSVRKMADKQSSQRKLGEKQLSRKKVGEKSSASPTTTRLLGRSASHLLGRSASWDKEKPKRPSKPTSGKREAKRSGGGDVHALTAPEGELNDQSHQSTLSAPSSARRRASLNANFLDENGLDDDDDETTEEKTLLPLAARDDDTDSYQDGDLNPNDDSVGIMQFDPFSTDNVLVVKENSGVSFPSCPVELDISSNHDLDDDPDPHSSNNNMAPPRSTTPEPQHNSADPTTSRWGKLFQSKFKSSTTFKFSGKTTDANDDEDPPSSIFNNLWNSSLHRDGGHQQLGDDDGMDTSSVI